MRRLTFVGLLLLLSTPVFAQETFVFFSSEQWTVPSGDTSRRTYFQPTDAIYFVDPADQLLKRINHDGSGGVSILKPGLGPVEFVYAHQNKLYISTLNAVWKSDGTEPNTVQIRTFPTATLMALDLIEARLYARVIGGAEAGMWVMIPISGLNVAGLITGIVTLFLVALVGCLFLGPGRRWMLKGSMDATSTSIHQLAVH